MADYNSVHKDKCAAEFMKLKDCYLVGLQCYPVVDISPPHFHTCSHFKIEGFEEDPTIIYIETLINIIHEYSTMSIAR